MKRGEINFLIAILSLFFIPLIYSSTPIECATGNICIKLSPGETIDCLLDYKLTNSGTINYFIPLKTTAEFNSFIINPPSDISITSCAPITECAGKTSGTDCKFQSVTCYDSSGRLLTPGLGTTVSCLDPIGKCDGNGNCISWSGRGCGSCPFGASSHACTLNGNQGRYSDNGNFWTNWGTYSTAAQCATSYGCGFLWLWTCWDDNEYWQMKP